MRKRIALVAVVQLVCVLVAVAPQLSARAAGDEYRLAVAPIDPIDPFRGAHVTARLSRHRRRGRRQRGRRLYVSLVRDGDLWRPGRSSRTRPEAGPTWRATTPTGRSGAASRLVRPAGRGGAARAQAMGERGRGDGQGRRPWQRCDRRPRSEVTGRSQPPATAGMMLIWVPSGVAVARPRGSGRRRCRRRRSRTGAARRESSRTRALMPLWLASRSSSTSARVSPSAVTSDSPPV